MSEKFIRLPEVQERTGISRSTIYEYIKQGIFPTSICLGARAKGFIEREIDAIVAARIAGKPDDEIRELVKTLAAKRQRMANEILEVA